MTSLGGLVAAAAWALLGLLTIAVGGTITGTTPHPIVAAMQGAAPRLLVGGVLLGAATLLAARPLPAILLLLVCGAWMLLLGGGTRTPGNTAANDTIASTATLRILSTNLLLSNTDAVGAATDIAGEDPDVLVTVETDEKMRTRLATLLPSYRPVTRGTGARGRWTTIWVHERTAANVTEAEPVRLELSELPAVTYRLGTRPVRIVGVHLHAPSKRDQIPTWEAELAELTETARRADRSDEPLVLAGDFNAGHAHPGMRELLNILADAGRGRFAGTPTWPVRDHAHGWYRWAPTLLDLDHILLGRGLRHSRHTTVRIAGSDHRAVVADIEAGGTDGRDEALPSRSSQPRS